MNIYHPNAAAIACKYIGITHAPEPLGWGVDGVVYPHPSAHTAVKIHSRQGSFANELAVYLRLADYGVTSFQTGSYKFNVPVLVQYNVDERVIEMSTVRPPF